jgi:hypothetical protein
MAQESVYLQIKYNTTYFYEKKSDILVLTFFTKFFGCNVPPFGILDECSSSFDFDFTQSQTVDMPTSISAATFRKISPFSIRLTASNFCSIVITCFRLADIVCNHYQTKCQNCTVRSTHTSICHSSVHVNFSQQTDGERLRGISRQAVWETRQKGVSVNPSFG